MDNSDISLLFYRYLCDVIGTEDVVNTRRKIYTAYEHVHCNKEQLLLCSGSKAEGLEIKGSDFDIMMIIRGARVYEDDDVIPIIHGSTSLAMDTSECKPGFTQLKMPTFHSTLAEYCDYKVGELYIASDKFREQGFIADPHYIIHGPCLSTKDGKYDIVQCFQCKHWIRQAHSWLLRSQKSWANCNVLDTIVDFGVLFVPIGCKGSLNSDLEWRISFSHAEKLLIWSFNHVQLICYALIKILLKEIIAHYTGDLLCSYFLKTIMFWICEETKSHQWEARNVCSCFLSCFDRLIYCVLYKTCVHYFIPENDLFENRFNRRQHAQLLSILSRLRTLGWACLLQTQTLQSFKSFLDQSSVINGKSYLLSLYTIKQSRYSICLYWPGDTKYAVYHCMRSKNKFYTYMISFFNQRFADALSKVDSIYNDNKHKYITYKKRLYHLLIGLNHDAISGWLMLASFFYVNKQYHECREIISASLLKCNLDKIVIANKLPNQEIIRFQLLQKLIPINHYSFTKTYSIWPVEFRSRSGIFPKDINVNEFGGDLHFSPVVFGLILHFLCNHHLGNLQGKAECIYALKNVIIYSYYMFCAHDEENALLFMSIMNSLQNDHSYSLF